MGRNKAFLVFQGRMFLWMIIEALTPLFDDMILVTREPRLYQGFPVRVIGDLFAERGPLTGIISGLAATLDPYNFCIACDMPLVKTAVVQHMMNRASDADAVIPRTQRWSRDDIERPEPLFGVYHRRCRPAMERHLRAGRRSLQEVIRSLNVCYLQESEVALLEPALRSFWSINTENEYRALQAYGLEAKGASSQGC